MKKIVLSLAVIAAIGFSACSKERTCSCSYKNTTTTVTTPRSSGSASTTVNTNESTEEDTYKKISKSDLIKYAGCVSNTSSSVDNYTTTVYTPTISGSGTFTFNSTVPQTADVSRTYQYESTCEIK